MTEERRLRRGKLWFMVLAVLLLSAAQSALSLVVVVRFEERLLPEITEKAELVGAEVCARIEDALVFDRDLNALRGVERFFDKVLEQHPEMITLTIVAPDGTALFRRGAAGDAAAAAGTAAAVDDPGHDLTLPIHIGGRQVGRLTVAINHRYAERTLREMTYDVLTVLAISLLITFGLASFVIQARFSGRIDAVLTMMDRLGKGDLRPNKADGIADRIGEVVSRLNGVVERVRDLYRASLVHLESFGPSAAAHVRTLTDLGERNRLNDPPVDDTPSATRLLALRLVAFTFFLAEEVIRPFLPLYVKQLAGDLATNNSLISLPFSLFIFVGAAAQPWGGHLSERYGYRRTFLLASLLSAVSLTLIVVTDGYWWMLAWRIVGAIGYGVAFAACQGYAVENTTPATRTRGIAVFIGGVMAASICGPSIGGMIADHLGFGVTLLFASGVILAAMVVGQALMGDGARRAKAQPLGWRELKGVLVNPSMLALLMLISVPAKILLNGALFYLTPLYLTSIGEPQAVVGRVMMVYGVTAVLLGPLAAGCADARPTRHHLFVGLGATLAGLGLAPLGVMPDRLWILVAGIGALGFGQALCIPVQLSLVTQFAARRCSDLGPAAVLGVFRFVERAGGALGPIVAATLVGELGYGGAIAAMGQLSALCAVAFLIAFAVFSWKVPAAEIGGQP